MIPYTLTDTSLTVVLDFTPHTIPSTHPNWASTIEALSNNANDNEIRALIDIPTKIAEFMQGKIQIKDRVLYFNGEVLDSYLARYILNFMEANDPKLVGPLCAFLENLMENPSYRAVQGLYQWVERSNLPITPDGHLLAWKIVGPDYKDLYSGKFDNSVGKIVEVPRNKVDENPDRTCSYGLHFCSYDYLPHYGNTSNRRIMVVKINPRDVAAFPHDYNISKGRCSRYEVVGEVPEDKVREMFPNDERVYYGFDVTLDTVIDAEIDWNLPLIRDDGLLVTDIEEASNEAVADYVVTFSDDSRRYYNTDGEHAWGEWENVRNIRPGDIPFEVGQVWRDRDGVEVLVTNVTNSLVITEGGAVWRESGRLNKNGTEHATDLIVLVQHA